MKRLPSLIAVLLWISVVFFLLELQRQSSDSKCPSNTDSQPSGLYLNSKSYQEITSPSPSIPSSLSMCPASTDLCEVEDRSTMEHVCFDLNVQICKFVEPVLSLPDVEIPVRTVEQKKNYILDENKFIAHREVIWIHGKPFVAPPEVLRIDTYNLGPGKRSSIRAAHWNHPCTAWMNTKMDTTASWLTEEELNRWAVMIKPGSVAIDIGAHMGDSTIPIAVAAGMTIAFEPMKTVYPVLRTQSIVNPLLNIYTHNLAVGSQNATFMWAYDCNGGADSVLAAEPFEVQMVTLVPFLKSTYPEEVLRNISFIKTDTEGHDMDIIETLEPLFSITQTKPILFIEWYIDHQFMIEHRMRIQMVAKSIGYVIFTSKGQKVEDMSIAEYVPDLVLIPQEMEDDWASGKRMNDP